MTEGLYADMHTGSDAEALEAAYERDRMAQDPDALAAEAAYERDEAARRRAQRGGR